MWRVPPLRGYSGRCHRSLALKIGGVGEENILVDLEKLPPLANVSISISRAIPKRGWWFSDRLGSIFELHRLRPRRAPQRTGKWLVIKVLDARSTGKIEKSGCGFDFSRISSKTTPKSPEISWFSSIFEQSPWADLPSRPECAQAPVWQSLVVEGARKINNSQFEIIFSSILVIFVRNSTLLDGRRDQAPSTSQPTSRESQICRSQQNRYRILYLAGS